ncbi:hypothetical protein EB796_005996 [Bugula neritina]|uniref:Uncharacterized protein n=1 Tax=Bugula neritina TaxID=10212 RepID=A0A7J7KBV9_BUGNE|nr:hypothetical protein EB796_005996 [Bugula neritina]
MANRPLDEDLPLPDHEGSSQDSSEIITGQESTKLDIQECLLDIKSGYLKPTWRYNHTPVFSNTNLCVTSWIFLDKSLTSRIVFDIEKEKQDIQVMNSESCLLVQSSGGLEEMESTMVMCYETGEELAMINGYSINMTSKNELITCTPNLAGDSPSTYKVFLLAFKDRPEFKCRILQTEDAIKVNFLRASLPCNQKLAILLYGLKLAYNVYDWSIKPIPFLIQDVQSPAQEFLAVMNSLPENLNIQAACFIKKYHVVYHFLNSERPNKNRLELVVKCEPQENFNICFRVDSSSNDILFSADGRSPYDNQLSVSDPEYSCVGFMIGECIYSKDYDVVMEIAYYAHEMRILNETCDQILAKLTENGTGYNLALTPGVNPEWKALIISAVIRYLFAMVRAHHQTKIPIIKKYRFTSNPITPEIIVSAYLFTDTS